MRVLILVVAVLSLSTAIWSQGEGGGGSCYVCSVATDNSCDDLGRLCSSNTFTVPCDLTVTLYCDIVNCTGNCLNCRVNARLFRQGGPNLALCTTNNEEDCAPAPDFDCDETGSSASLVHGTVYTIEVCLMPCFYQSCSDCQNCQARAWVKAGPVPYQCP